MGVMYFRDGVLAQFHDAFTVKHAPQVLSFMVLRFSLGEWMS
jgi:hypothetical protein